MRHFSLYGAKFQISTGATLAFGKVKVMERFEHINKNKPLPPAAEDLVAKMLDTGEKVLFAIVGDLSIDGKYCDSALIFTDCKVVAYDGSPERTFSYPFSELLDVQAKRMYGNATLSAVMPNGKREIFFRYTYSVASLCDAAAMFINRVRDGEELSGEVAIMGVMFERALSVCPKCGRTLLHPGAECIMCRSKKKIVKKLSVYILPHVKTLILCIFLSLLTTAMALVPPIITGFIVDEVFPTGSGSTFAPLKALKASIGADKPEVLLTVLIAGLLVIYLLEHIISTVRQYLMRTVGDKAVSALRSDIYRKAQFLPMRFYDKTSTGSVINRISSDSATLQQFVLRITQEAIVHFFQLIGIVVIMMLLNPVMTLLSLIPVVFIVIFSRIFSRKIRPYYHRIWPRW